ncbi:MAG: twin-arginine translocation signal domain-containing protein [Candidatus Aenigmatarchaeota archaeon]
MRITRRDFLKYCTISAGALGLSTTSLMKLEQALAKEGQPTVVWLQGQACGGCVTSMLNSITYTDIASLLTDEPVPGTIGKGIDLEFMPVVMAAAGDKAIEKATASPNVLVVEGSIPASKVTTVTSTSYVDNGYCDVWEPNGGSKKSMLEAVRDLITFDGTTISSPLFVIALGTCAAYGGIPAAKPNPTGARSVTDILTDTKWLQSASGVTTSSQLRTLLRNMKKIIINIAGCPPHPDWFVGTVAYLLRYGERPAIDSLGRPVEYYGQRLCDSCPRFSTPVGCLKMIGCKGMRTKADCSYRMWNVEPGYSATGNYCPNSGSPCLGCVTPYFWDRNAPFFKLR